MNRKSLSYALILGLGLLMVGVTSMLSYVFQSTVLLGVALWGTILLMVLDTIMLYPAIIKKVGYLSHHIVAALGSLVTFFYIEEMLALGIGILGYTALGAAFRRLAFCTQEVFPKAKATYQAFVSLQMFFDFCDLLFIYLFWSVIEKLPLSLVVIYFALVAVRYYININDVMTQWSRRRATA